MPATPEHVLWAIERKCPFRHSANWTDPEQTARELRPLQAYSDAVAGNRIFEGICVDRLPTEPSAKLPAMGFPITEIFNAYGEKAFISKTCGDCPASSEDDSLVQLAACHGCFLVSELKATINKVVEERQKDFADREPPILRQRAVKQGFYGLWLKPSWSGAMLSRTLDLFVAVERSAETVDPDFQRFVAALGRAKRHQLTMWVKLMPAGKVQGRWWHVVQHCPHCRAEWETGIGRCTICGFDGKPSPMRKRHAKGTRPFIPLDMILGVEHAEFLKRYAHYQLDARQTGVVATEATDNSVPGLEL